MLIWYADMCLIKTPLNTFKHLWKQTGCVFLQKEKRKDWKTVFHYHQARRCKTGTMQKSEGLLWSRFLRSNLHLPDTVMGWTRSFSCSDDTHPPPRKNKNTFLFKEVSFPWKTESFGFITRKLKVIEPDKMEILKSIKYSIYLLYLEEVSFCVLPLGQPAQWPSELKKTAHSPVNSVKSYHHLVWKRLLG